MNPSRRTVALLLALAATAGPAHAQATRYSFFSAGRGGAPGERYIDPHFTVSAGYGFGYGSPGGVSVSVRSIISYARFRPDARSVLDSLGLTSGEVEGGTASVMDTGGDLVAGVGGRIGAYGFYGLHYYWDSYSTMTVVDGDDETHNRRRFRSDLGPSYGAGVQVGVAREVAVFGEWYRGGGFDDRMIRQRGFRFGLTGAF
jgi:hypothetical protein